MRRQIAQNDARGGQLFKGTYRSIEKNLSAQRLQMSSERIGELLRTAAHDRPADGVSGGAEHQAETGGCGKFQGYHRVRGQTGEERARLAGAKARFSKAARRL